MIGRGGPGFEREPGEPGEANTSRKVEMGSRLNIVLVRGDITTQKVDAIVNAANDSLLGGSGVDGAIHRAAGPKLYDECKTLGGCDTGDAKVTKAYRLPAKIVIHAVGPDYDNYDDPKEAEKLLRSAYERSLQLAEENKAQSVAFPSISTGLYAYPKKDAAKVVHEVVDEFKDKAVHVKEIRFVLFSHEDLEVYQDEFGIK